MSRHNKKAQRSLWAEFSLPAAHRLDLNDLFNLDVFILTITLEPAQYFRQEMVLFKFVIKIAFPAQMPPPPPPRSSQWFLTFTLITVN